MTPGVRNRGANSLDRLRARAALTAAAALLIAHGWGLLATPRDAVGTQITAERALLRLNPNRATVAELQLLPRIGPKIARRIVAYRESAEHTPAFRSADDLAHVKYIGPVTVELLRPFLRFTAAPAESASSQESP